jgi:hypothetical protein
MRNETPRHLRRGRITAIPTENVLNYKQYKRHEELLSEEACPSIITDCGPALVTVFFTVVAASASLRCKMPKF